MLLQLRTAMLDAFDSTADLKTILFFYFDRTNYAVVSGDPNFDGGLRDVISWAIRHECLPELVAAARNENPRNRSLKEVSEELGISSRPFANTLVPEAVLLEAAGMESTGPWLQKYLEAEMRTFRIEHDGVGFGTGFLVRENLAMTADHVFADNGFYDAGADRKGIKLRFGYRISEEGKPQSGVAHDLHAGADWVVQRSPRSALDYVLFKLNGSPGSRATGETDKAPVRGWLKPVRRTPAAPEPLIVMQHPRGRPMEIAIGPVSVPEPQPATASLAAFWHRTNTQEGSSGAPCFDGKWNLVGIHQGHRPGLNRAISMEAVLADLHATGDELAE